MRKQPARPQKPSASAKTASVKGTRKAAAEPFYKRYRLLTEFFVILSLCLLTYGNSIGNGYNIDDGYIVSLDAANQQTAKGIEGIKDIMTSKYSSGFGVTYSYRPLGKVTMAIEYSLWGNDPQKSHLVNVLLFALNAFLLLLFFRKIAGQFQFRQDKVLYLAILLFIVHPIHTEVVCSIKNREELLCFGFMLGAVLTYLRYLRASEWTARAGYLVLVIALVLLSLLSKQSGFNVLSIVLLLNIYRYLETPGKAMALRERLKDPDTWKYVIPAVLIFYCLVLVLDQIPSRLPSDDQIRLFETDPYGFAPASHIFPNGVQTLLFYCSKLFIPYPLLFYYGYDMLPDRGWNSFYPYLGLLVFGGIAWFLYRSFKTRTNRFAAFWLLFFGITLIPFGNIGLFPNVTGNLVGERLAYQASAGFCLLLALTLDTASAWMSRNIAAFRQMPPNRLLFLAAAAFVLPYLLLTIDRNRYWENKVTLYEHDIPKLDRSMRANFMMGSAIMNTVTTTQQPLPERLALLERAKHYFKRSLDVYPKSTDGLLSMGKLYGAYFNDLDSAEYYFKQIDTLVPKAYVNAREMLGDISLMRGDTLTAMTFYREAIGRYGQNYTVYNKLKDLLFLSGRFGEMEQLADTAISNNWPVGYADKGDVLLNRRDTARAIQFYELALRNGWQDEVLVRNLRNYYQSRGMTDKLKLLPVQ